MKKMRSKHVLLFTSLLVLLALNLASSGGVNYEILQQEPQVAKNVNAAEFKKLLDLEEVLLLDVRTASEFESGHLIDSENMDYNQPDFRTAISQLAKDKPVLVYCRSGRRSSYAMEIMKELGFQQIYNLEGGIESWAQAKLPIIK